MWVVYSQLDWLEAKKSKIANTKEPFPPERNNLMVELNLSDNIINCSAKAICEFSDENFNLNGIKISEKCMVATFRSAKT